MRFGYTVLSVDDVDASLAFAPHATARANPGHNYVDACTSARPLGMEVGLVTDDVPPACQRAVAAGATLLTPPTTKPWGQTVANVRCPDGTLVELCTAVG